MALTGVAKATLQIIEDGRYQAPSGGMIEFAAEQRAAVAGTVLYAPGQALALLGAAGAARHPAPPQIDVTAETTQAAAYRLTVAEGVVDPAVLNFASARNPGGGFLTGAKAQEEDVTRSSGLYPCLLTQPDYYTANRSQRSLLYTDHLIYSPRVPWFRTSNRELSEPLFLASVITAPAPNAGEARRVGVGGPAIEEALRRRAGLVLAVARAHGHRTLLLGAWGCGVFRNRPELVADAFGVWLAGPEFAGWFDRVVFAVYDPSAGQATLRAFEQRFPAP